MSHITIPLSPGAVIVVVLVFACCIRISPNKQRGKGRTTVPRSRDPSHHPRMMTNVVAAVIYGCHGRKPPASDVKGMPKTTTARRTPRSRHRHIIEAFAEDGLWWRQGGGSEKECWCLLSRKSCWVSPKYKGDVT